MLGYFTSGWTLNAGIKLVAQARDADSSVADALFQQAYDKFASIASTNSRFSEALYNWGFGLLHQARNKPADEAIRILEQAIDKFTVCLSVKTSYLGAAIDGGVTYLELAKLKGVGLDHELYAKAKEFFDKAEAIQIGAASYNLACMYAMNNEGDACLRALEKAKGVGLIPDKDVVLIDDDLINVRNLPWFSDFIESLTEDVKATESVSVVGEAAVNADIHATTEAAEAEKEAEKTEQSEDAESSENKITDASSEGQDKTS